MSELESILQKKAQQLTARQIQVPLKLEKQLLITWKDDRGFAIQFNLSWALHNQKDLSQIVAIMDECQKELLRRGVVNH